MVLTAQSSVGRTRRGQGSSLWPAASPEPETDSSWFGGTAVAGNRPPAPPEPRSPRRQQQSPAHAQEERGGHRGGRAPGPGARHHSGAGPRGHPASGLRPWGPQLRVRCRIFIPQSESERQNGLSYRKLFVPDAGADSPQELWFLVLDPGFSLLL